MRMRTLVQTAGLLACLGMAAPASADLLLGGSTGDNVGNIDTIVGTGYLTNSSLQSEIDLIKDILGLGAGDTVDATKLESAGGAAWDPIWDTGSGMIDPDLWGLDFEPYMTSGDISEYPEYYLLKIGSGNLVDPIDAILYSNEDLLRFAAIDLMSWADWGIEPKNGNYASINITRISHVTTVGGENGGGGGGEEVPTPTTPLLLGAGLLVLAQAQRRRKA